MVKSLLITGCCSCKSATSPRFAEGERRPVSSEDVEEHDVEVRGVDLDGGVKINCVEINWQRIKALKERNAGGT